MGAVDELCMHNCRNRSLSHNQMLTHVKKSRLPALHEISRHHIASSGNTSKLISITECDVRPKEPQCAGELHCAVFSLGVYMLGANIMLTRLYSFVSWSWFALPMCCVSLRPYRVQEHDLLAGNILCSSK